MARLNELLKKNIYLDIFIDLISYLQNSRISPHEKMAAAHLLRLRSLYWGTDIPVISTARSGGNIPAQCPACYAKTIKMGAASDNSYEPYTSFIENFRHKLNSMDMKVSNGWVYWMQIVDSFYSIIDFLNYFIYEFKEGIHADLYLNDVLGISSREGSYKHGLAIELQVEGTVENKELITIDFTNVLTTDLADKYFVLYKESIPYIFWFDNGGVAPELGLTNSITTPIPIAGLITITEIKDVTINTIASITTDLGSIIWNIILPSESVSDLFVALMNNSATVNQPLVPGTASIGISEAETKIFGHDGSILSDGNITTEDYIETWNNIKVPFDRTAGVDTPYLKRVGGINTGGCCWTICWEPSVGGNAQCCRASACSSSKYTGLIMTTSVTSNLPELNFNTPSNVHNLSSKPGGDGILKQCPACAW